MPEDQLSPPFPFPSFTYVFQLEQQDDQSLYFKLVKILHPLESGSSRELLKASRELRGPTQAPISLLESPSHRYNRIQRPLARHYRG